MGTMPEVNQGGEVGLKNLFLAMSRSFHLARMLPPMLMKPWAEIKKLFHTFNVPSFT